jgi:sterol desaturase/sphingolipid hydroxylase (fatty acid hydroxylase superfamily)
MRASRSTEASLPLFENPILDRLTRTHPVIVPLVYGPAVLVLLAWGVGRGGLGVVESGLLAAGGLLVWTFAEYWIHRGLFHWMPPGENGRTFQWRMHGYHHEHPSDPLRLVMPLTVSLTLFVAFLGLWWVVFGTQALPFHAGFVTGYIAYDLLHWRAHAGPSRSGWLARRRYHHLVHHAPKYESRINFGVSTGLWDRVFGTHDDLGGPA